LLEEIKINYVKGIAEGGLKKLGRISAAPPEIIHH